MSPRITSRRAATVLAATLVAFILALVAVALVGVTIDASRWREPIQESLETAIGRAVRVEGPVLVRVSLWPTVRARDVRIANPPDFPQPHFAEIGEVRLAVDLLPLLANTLRVRELRASGVTVRFARTADGKGNWSFGRASAAGDERGSSEAPKTTAAMPSLDIHGIVLADLRVEWAADRNAPRVFEIESLEARARQDARTSIEIRGKVEKRHPYSFVLEGAPLAKIRRGDPWDFEATLVHLDAIAHANGRIDFAGAQPSAEILLGAGIPDPAALARLLQADLPAVGASSIGATLQWTPGRAALQGIVAVVGRTALSGSLALETSGTQPKLVGELATPALDLLPFLADDPSAEGREPETLAQAFRELERRDLEIQRISRLDADVRFDIGEVRGLPGDVRNVSLTLRAESGRLAAPLQVMLAGAPFVGTATIDATVTPSQLRLDAVARDAPLGGIAEVIFGAPYVDGQFKAFSLALAAAGDRPGEIVTSLEANGELTGARLTYGNFEGGDPVRMQLDRLRISQPRGQSLAAAFQGALVDKPFSGTMAAQSIAHVVRTGTTPFRLDAQATGVKANASGTIAPAHGDDGTRLEFEVNAARARDIGPWLGLSSQADVPVALTGNMALPADGLRGRLAFRLAKTTVDVDLSATQAAGRSLVRTEVVSDRLDVDELGRVFAGPQRGPDARATIDIPILPEGLDLGDSDFAVRIVRIDGLAVGVSDLAFEGSLRGRRLEPSPFSLEVEGMPLAGAIALDLRGKVPTSQVWLAGDDIDVSAVLRKLGLGERTEMRADKLRLYVDIQASRLGEALERSTVIANVDSGRLVLRDPSAKGRVWVRVESAEVRADPGERLTARIDGRVNRIPVALRVTAGRLRQFIEPGKRMPVVVEAQGAEARLVVAGEVAPAVREPDVDLTVAFTGSRLSALERFFRTSLPPWGPYALASRLRISPRGYEVSDLRLSVGESVLDGRATLDTARSPPRLDVSLTAGQVRLDDFPIEAWSPFDAALTEVPKSRVAAAKEAAAETTAEVQSIFSAELLRAYDARIAVDVEHVLSGPDRLGDGRLRATVAEGRLQIDPVEINMPGGSANLALAYEPVEGGVVSATRIRVDRFDYGVIARRLDPATTVGGKFSLDVDVSGRAKRLGGMLEEGSGRIDFAGWPERLDAGTFDLWATNLFLAVLPAIGSNVSQVNCAIGQFDLKDGKLESRQVLIDTTHTRAIGAGRVNFGTERLEFRLVPRPKVPQFFALATPVEVVGTIEAFDVNVRAADVFETVLRWVAALVVGTIQKLTTTPPPADGADVCTNVERPSVPVVSEGKSGGAEPSAEKQ